MRIIDSTFICAGLLIVDSVYAFPGLGLSKRALKYDKSCDVKYGSLSAKQYIEKSIDFMPGLAKAGKEGLDLVIQTLENQAKLSPGKKPKADKDKLKRIIATYRVLFGDIRAKLDDGTDNPTFKQEAADHIKAIKETSDSLQRMTSSRNPDLIIHCNDEWLSTTVPKDAKNEPSKPGNAGSRPSTPENSLEKPKEKPKNGAEWLFDTDRNYWMEVMGGKPCRDRNAAVTFINTVEEKKRTGGARPERMTFCPDYFKIQQSIDKDNEPHLWEFSKNKLPENFIKYKPDASKETTLPFHISAFGSKIGAKWFHEFMHSGLFNTNRNLFKDKKLATGPNGKAYGFDGAVELAKQNGGKNVGEASRNIENILYWSLAMYFDQWVWSTGKPEDISTLTAPANAPAQPGTEKAKRARRPSRPKPNPPKPDPPKPEPPKPEPPKPEPPKPEPPKPEPPKPEPPKPEPPKPEPPKPDPPKSDPPKPDPPKSEKPADPPKTDKSAEPPKTSAPTPAASSQAAPSPGSSQAAPSTAQASPASSAAQTSAPASSKATASTSASGESVTTPISRTSTGSSMATTSAPESCSNTLCTRTSASMSSTVSADEPQATEEPEPIGAGLMDAAEIIAIADMIAAEQIPAMQAWDQPLNEMEQLPVEADPTASLGTGMPMPTGAANGTWNVPPAVRARMMYD